MNFLPALSHDLFYFEDNVAGQESLHASDLMVSDWSGASLDYALGLKKPVIFIDVPKKINDPNFTQIKLEPIEISIQTKLASLFQALVRTAGRKLSRKRHFSCGSGPTGV